MTVFECDKDKLPGPEGFSLSVLLRYWEVVKGELTEVMSDFYTNFVFFFQRRQSL